MVIDIKYIYSHKYITVKKRESQLIKILLQYIPGSLRLSSVTSYHSDTVSSDSFVIQASVGKNYSRYWVNHEVVHHIFCLLCIECGQSGKVEYHTQ